MADAKVSIEVQASGADEARKAVQDAAKATDAATAATKANAAAAKEAEAANGALAALMGGEAAGAAKQAATATDTATAAAKANTGAVRGEMAEIKKAVKQLVELKVAERDEAAAARDAAKAQKAEEKALKDAEKAKKDVANASNKLASATQNAGNAIHKIMAGDIVGGFKMAKNAVKDFWAAIVANPALAALAAVAAAIMAIKKGWDDAKQAALDYQAAEKDLADRDAAIDEMRGKNDVGRLSDDDLDLERRRLEAEVAAREKNTRAARLDAHAAHMNQGATAEDGGGTLSGAVMAGASTFAKNTIAGAKSLFTGEQYLENTHTAQANAEAAKANLDEQIELEKQARDRLDAINQELDRRKKANQEAADAAKETAGKERESADAIEAARAAFQRTKEIDETTKRFGKAAGLAYQRDKLREDRDAAESDKERLEIDKQIWQVEQQITAENEAQAKKKADAAQEQADWARGRKLAKMDAGDRAQHIQGEIDALRREKPTDENKARMRSLIDERDRAKAEDARNAEQKSREAKQDEAARKALEKRLWERDFDRADEKGQRRMLRDQMKQARQIADPIERQNRLLDLEDRMGKVGGSGRSGAKKKKSGLSLSAGERSARARRSATEEYMRRRIMARSGVAFTSGGKPPANKPAGKTEEAKGIDQTNKLLTDIKKALE